MKILSLLLLAASLAFSACAGTPPVPPHQSGDGGRGMNPGARAESSNGAGVDRTPRPTGKVGAGHPPLYVILSGV
ncbi:MAG: hypothetical protein WDN28_16880 [Chthoniobacter sp.]